MGCDIHAYVEYRNKLTGDHDDQDASWDCLTGQLSLPRYYNVFGMIAGVHGNKSLFEPKGIPEDMGWQAQEDWWIYIDDKPEGQEECDCENIVSLKTAQQYETYGSRILYHKNGKPYRVEHPDWHSATWLTTSEFNEALSHTDSAPAYKAVLAMMESLESNNQEARIIVWFDN